MGESKRKGKTRYHSSKVSKSAVTIWIIAFVVIVVGAYDFFQRSKTSPLTSFDPVKTKGSAEAPIKVLEFIDFQCPHCAQGSKILHAFMEEHPGKIQLSIKYFPLGQLNSMVSAQYAECAARQDKFWELVDPILEKQDQWRTLLRVRKFLDNLSVEAKLNLEDLRVCLDNDKPNSQIERDKTLGESNFVRSTPTYFINGEIQVGIHSMRKRVQELIDNPVVEE